MSRRRTWKRRSIGAEDIKAALATAGGNVTKAANALGLARETLSRWLTRDPTLVVASGPAKRPGASQQKAPRTRSTTAFGAWVRRTYTLTPGEAEVLRMAEIALALARNKGTSDTGRLAAMREFRAALRQLDLPEVLNDGEVEEPATVRPFPRRVG